MDIKSTLRIQIDADDLDGLKERHFMHYEPDHSLVGTLCGDVAEIVGSSGKTLGLAVVVCTMKMNRQALLHGQRAGTTANNIRAVDRHDTTTHGPRAAAARIATELVAKHALPPEHDDFSAVDLVVINQTT